MIGWLNGQVVVKQGGSVIIDVAGVGYEVSVPVGVLEHLVQGQTMSLFIHENVREDGRFLFGFISLEQREMFRTLIRVSGIGPKLALLILSGFSVENLIRIVQAQESTALTSLPGIGKKTAERLLIELKDSVSKYDAKKTSAEHELEYTAVEEALAALIALDIKPVDAHRLIDSAILQSPDADTATLIKKALALKLQREP